MSVPSPSALSRHVAELYPAGAGVPPVLRLMQIYRPYLCPFDLLLPLVQPGGTMLDVGCGGGLWLGLCAKFGLIRSGLGFDSSPMAIAAARAMQANIRPPGDGPAPVLEFQHRAVAEGWPQGTFDTVTIIDVMHHVPVSQQRDVITQAASHLKPGGILIYKDIDEGHRFKATMNRLHDLVMARQWIHYARAEDVITWGEAAGLEKLAFMDMHRLWYPHELIVFGKKR